MKFIKNSITLVLVFLLLATCTSNTIYKKPKNLIPKIKMVDLLVDMYLANAATNIKNKDLKKKINYMPLVYDKYGIDSLRFNISNEYYMSRIDDYELLYKEVESRLKKILDTIETTQNTIDSLEKKQIFEIKKANKKELKP
jgi:hypothetical protein